MTTKVRNSAAAYALGFVLLILAVLLRWALEPLMGDSLPLVTLFAAVAAAVWLGGYRLAIPLALIGYVACHYLFIPPRYALIDAAGHKLTVDLPDEPVYLYADRG